MKWVLSGLLALGVIAGAATAAYKPLSKRAIRHMDREELVVRVGDLQRIIERQAYEIGRLKRRLRFQRRGRCE